MSDTLTLNLKTEYFEKIRDGVKPFEFRLQTLYWQKRLVGRNYKWVVFCLGYPAKNDDTRRIKRPYRGYEKQRILHEHFGAWPVDVFAIYTNT